MTADRAALKAAVLKVLIDTREADTYSLIADAIVDAVIAVGGEDATIEWGARCLNNRCAAAGKIYHRQRSREKVEHSIGQAEDGHFELVQRRLWRSDWEVVD